ncbi:transcriptional regulator, LacI family [Xylanimonas cellulosilytica DSM 15894]|uniref:Transcriptional regulator, LacI family n=1 Tax=Xylanimonas cellulosilytica (strain DSM 15894 / JCM 12276 / CECT 5975 / KCTC 9989 / LMG 20990 / NBRC 107835 / XIL07) TaxID=446471 RepID=D1BXA5_XYLCX|nr:LacI family DNA-binding transcriptional regulator [Xylanimonas cellulosilytica]ACZ31673.1 transcriptional regulator, LacI family [Xylanimonas cellulosilytica DSM 15894]
MSSPRPTIADIANAVGVSAPTVSKVINGRTDVAESTRARVEEALDRLGYRRRRTGPPIQGTGLIDLVFHRIGSPWATEILQGVENAAAEHRVSVILTELGGKHRPPDAWVDTTLARPPLGVLMVSATLSADQRERLARRSIPVVVVDTDGEPPEDVPSVGTDNWSGGLQATRHLIALGHTRIAAIGGPPDMLCVRARLDGYRSAHMEAGLVADPRLIRSGNFYVETGYLAGRELLTLPEGERPTAIFAGSDMQALGVMRAATELGVSVPHDLSVVGYDDLPVVDWVSPSLTSVDQKLATQGAVATRLLLDLAAGRTPATPRISLPSDLVIRGSTAPPRR